MLKNALYLRLSLADGDLGKNNKDESNSIENQRTLLVNFLQDRDDLADEYIEYVASKEMGERGKLFSGSYEAYALHPDPAGAEGPGRPDAGRNAGKSLFRF